MAKLFFRLSGENPTLPFSEIVSILEAGNYRYRILERLPQVIRLESTVECIEWIKARSALTRLGCLELFQCSNIHTDIMDKMRSTSFKELITQDESFSVRVQRIRGVAPHLMRVNLERKLGEVIIDRVKGIKVNLTTPKKPFFGILTGHQFLFGLKKAEISPKPFIERGPRKRPYFHPSAMSAKLARCMVNLAQPKSGDLVLDSFCGTASILVEAGLLGCHVFGIDVQLRMVKGSLRNLFYYNVKPLGMAVADARHLPLANIDCIVTDPPYGRLATTLGWSTKQIVADFLSTIQDMLTKGRKICISSPKSIKISNIGKDLGLKHKESHFIYVHRSLTREIAVFERT